MSFEKIKISIVFGRMLRTFSRTLGLGARFGTVQKRAASSGTSGGIFGPGEPVTYAGVTIYKPSKFNYWAGEIIGAQLWYYCEILGGIKCCF